MTLRGLDRNLAIGSALSILMGVCDQLYLHSESTKNDVFTINQVKRDYREVIGLFLVAFKLVLLEWSESKLYCKFEFSVLKNSHVCADI